MRTVPPCASEAIRSVPPAQPTRGTFQERRRAILAIANPPPGRDDERDTQAQTPVVIEGDGVELRTKELGGGMSAVFVRVPAGADFRPALTGLSGDLCQCPHWGYILKGRVKMHTPDGELVYTAGQAYYWAPGHAPEALEDSEYVEFSPTDEFNHVLDHIKAQG